MRDLTQRALDDAVRVVDMILADTPEIRAAREQVLMAVAAGDVAAVAEALEAARVPYRFRRGIPQGVMIDEVRAFADLWLEMYGERAWMLEEAA